MESVTPLEVVANEVRMLIVFIHYLTDDTSVSNSSQTLKATYIGTYERWQADWSKMSWQLLSVESQDH